MPSPKSGSAGTADAPVEPDQAQDAADAKPGDVSSTQANPAQTQSQQWDEVKVNSGGGGDDDEQSSRNHWISIELKDAKGQPVPDEAYEVKLSDGTISSGSLDDKGRARIEGVPPGQCEVRFPRLHMSEWKKA